jgi:hypothetical protein
MRHFMFSLSLFAILLALALNAQDHELKAQPTSATCLPSTTLEELTKALDDAISGPADRDRTCLRQLLLPDARLTPIAKSPEGSFTPRILTVDDWINAVARRGSTPMFERQVKVGSDTYGHFAHLWSTYEIRPTPDGAATVTGINSVQAVNDGIRWHVLSVLWEPDTTAGPVPEKYMP